MHSIGLILLCLNASSGAVYSKAFTSNCLRSCGTFEFPDQVILTPRLSRYREAQVCYASLSNVPGGGFGKIMSVIAHIFELVNGFHSRLDTSRASRPTTRCVF